MYHCILLSLALTLVLSPWTSAQTTRLDTAPGIEKIQTELLEQMTTNLPATRQPTIENQPATENMYHIIVNLHPSYRIDHRRADGLAQLQQHVATAQDAILKSRKLGALTVLTPYQNIFSFSALANEEAILELAAMGHVEFIETVPVMQKMDTQSHPLTGVDRIRAAGLTGRDVTIAIIDDGIDAAHPAFGGDTSWPNNKIIGGFDFADHDDDPRNDCAQQSHGTAVAGVAAGNGGGVLGTAPDATIILLKIQSALRCGGLQLDGDLLGALDWIISHRQQFGIDIISMSFGGHAFGSASTCDNAMLAVRRLIDLAYDAGMIIFAAAGNEAQSNAISQPACLSNVISVGAVYDTNLGSTGFSICGDTLTGPDRVTCYSNSADFLDILAPAHCATTASTTYATGRNSCFGGTSSATPFAAGVAAALLEAAEVRLNNDSMRRLLVESGVAVFDDKSGLFTPRLDAQAAYDRLATAPSPTPDVPCTNCTQYTGALSAIYDLDVQPHGTYYSSPSGTHNGWLKGPDQTNFNLYLLQWSGFRWVTVATSYEIGSEEFITYQGTAGYYAWIIFSSAGSGSYDIWLQQP